MKAFLPYAIGLVIIVIGGGALFAWLDSLSTIQGIYESEAGQEALAYDSGVTGKVLLGPTCPALRDPPDPECADRPFKTRLVLVAEEDGRPHLEFESDDNGIFRISVPPGTYTIRSASAEGSLPQCASQEEILVTPGDYAVANVFCDSGIR